MKISFFSFIPCFFLSTTLFSQPDLVRSLQDNERISLIPPNVWAHEQAGISYEGSNLEFGRLENGMRFGIGKATSDKACNFSLLVSVGSTNETPEEFGMAHFIEHMVIRNSQNFPNGELYQYLAETYGDENIVFDARTSSVFTRYEIAFEECSEADLPRAIKMLADIAFRAEFRSEDMKKEAQIIEAECSKRLHQVSRRGSIGFEQVERLLQKFAHLWPRTLGYPLGTSESRKAFKTEQLTSFYQRWYIPANMAIAYVGKHDANQIKDLLREEFAQFASKEVPPLPPSESYDNKDIVLLAPSKILGALHVDFADVSTPYNHPRFDETSLKSELVYWITADIMALALEEAQIKSGHYFFPELKLTHTASGARSFNVRFYRYEQSQLEEGILRTFATLNSLTPDYFEAKLSLASID